MWFTDLYLTPQCSTLFFPLTWFMSLWSVYFLARWKRFDRAKIHLDCAMFSFPNNALNIFVFLYEKKAYRQSIIYFLHWRMDKVNKWQRNWDISKYYVTPFSWLNWYLLWERCFRAESNTFLQVWIVGGKRVGVLPLPCHTNTKIITNSVNQYMLSFVKSFEIIFLGTFEVLKFV